MVPKCRGRLPSSNWFTPKSNVVKSERLKMEGGTTPDNLLSLRIRCVNFFSLPRLSGMVPRNSFPVTSSSERDVKFPRDEGMTPVRLFHPKYNCCRFFKDPSSGGISPINLFLSTSNKVRLEQRDKFVGISPTKELLKRPRRCSLCKRPISGGIVPMNLLLKRAKTLRKLKFPTKGERVPVSLEESRSNAVTLRCRRPQVTRSHSQKWRELFQELRTPRGSWVILALIAYKANRSVSLFPAMEKSRQYTKRVVAHIRIKQNEGERENMTG